MNFIKKKIKGHKKGHDSDEDLDAAVYARQTGQENSGEVHKNSEEWQFFQQLTQRVQDTVQKTQTTLTKIKEASAITEISRPGYLEPEDEVKPPPAAVKSWVNFEEEGSAFPELDTKDTGKPVPPRPPPPKSQKTPDEPSAEPPIKEDADVIVPVEPLPCEPVSEEPQPSQESAPAVDFSLLEEFGFNQEPVPTVDLPPNLDVLIGQDEEIIDDPFDTSFVDISVPSLVTESKPVSSDTDFFGVDSEPKDEIDPFDTSFVDAIDSFKLESKDSATSFKPTVDADNTFDIGKEDTFNHNASLPVDAISDLQPVEKSSEGTEDMSNPFLTDASSTGASLFGALDNGTQQQQDVPNFFRTGRRASTNPFEEDQEDDFFGTGFTDTQASSEAVKSTTGSLLFDISNAFQDQTDSQNDFLTDSSSLTAANVDKDLFGFGDGPGQPVDSSLKQTELESSPFDPFGTNEQSSATLASGTAVDSLTDNLSDPFQLAFGKASVEEDVPPEAVTEKRISIDKTASDFIAQGGFFTEKSPSTLDFPKEFPSSATPGRKSSIPSGATQLPEFSPVVTPESKSSFSSNTNQFGDFPVSKTPERKESIPSSTVQFADFPADTTPERKSSIPSSAAQVAEFPSPVVPERKTSISLAVSQTEEKSAVSSAFDDFFGTSGSTEATPAPTSEVISPSNALNDTTSSAAAGGDPFASIFGRESTTAASDFTLDDTTQPAAAPFDPFATFSDSVPETKVEKSDQDMFNPFDLSDTTEAAVLSDSAAAFQTTAATDSTGFDPFGDFGGTSMPSSESAEKQQTLPDISSSSAFADFSALDSSSDQMTTEKQEDQPPGYDPFDTSNIKLEPVKDSVPFTDTAAFEAFAAKFEQAIEKFDDTTAVAVGSAGEDLDDFDPFGAVSKSFSLKVGDGSKADDGFGSMDIFDPFAMRPPKNTPVKMPPKELSQDSFDDDDAGPDFSVVIRPKFREGKDIPEVSLGPPPMLPPPPKSPVRTPAQQTTVSRFNPFDKDGGLAEDAKKDDFIAFEDSTSAVTSTTTNAAVPIIPAEKEPPPALGEAGVKRTDSVESPSTPLFDEDTSQPLEEFKYKFEGDGWEMMLRQPNKKKITGSRFWKKVFLRMSDNSILYLYNKKEDNDPFQEVPLQACYSLSEVGAQQYDQYGKIFTVKLQYIFYKERVGVRPGQISKVMQGQITTVGQITKLGLPLEHAPQVSQLLKLGTQTIEDIKTFVQVIEDALFHLQVHRDRALTYKTEEIQVTVHDEFYVEQDKTGHVYKQKARVRIFFLAFVTGMPDIEVGLNDLTRQGKEVVGRYDIMPVVTEEWIRLESCEFHSCVQQEEFEKNRIIKLRPPDACSFELMRFRIRPPRARELPLQVKAVMKVTPPRIELRCDILVPGYHSRKHGQVPCEDIQIKFPIPECWIYLFRVEKHFRYGSLKSAARKPGKIKGLERIMGTAQSLDTSLIEVSTGQAKYEHASKAVIWRIPRLPKEGQGAYTQHLFVLRLDLTSFDQVPDSFSQHLNVEFTMPATTVSHTTVRSISVTNPNPPEKYVRYLSKHEYKVELNMCTGTSENDLISAAAGVPPVATTTSTTATSSPVMVTNGTPPVVGDSDSD